DYRAEENTVAGAGAYEKRNRRNEGAGHARGEQLAAHLIALVSAARGEAHLVMRNGASPDILVEEPLHGAVALQIHSWGHDSLDFTLELSCGEAFLGVLGDQRLQQSHESRVGIRRIGLAQHFPEHMHDPSTFAVNHLIVRGIRLGGRQAHAHDERAGLGRRAVIAGAFSEKTLAVAKEPSVESVVRVFLRVGKEKREIIGDGFVDPLIAVAGPANDIPPPLMSHFVKRNNLREELLAGRVEAGTLLVFGRQERVSGDVKKARPALPEGAGNLRNAEMMKRKGTGILFAEMDGGIDFTGKLLQGVGGTRRRGLDGYAGVREITAGKLDGRSEVHDGTAQTGLYGLFELFVRVKINDMVFRGHGSQGVFAEVE